MYAHSALFSELFFFTRLMTWRPDLKSRDGSLDRDLKRIHKNFCHTWCLGPVPK